MAARVKISKRNRYYVNPERQLELLHFCRQYKDWTNLISSKALEPGKDPTADAAIELEPILQKIKDVDESAYESDNLLWLYILDGVTNNKSYEELNPPCSRSTYYDRYRKFFYILDLKRA